MTCDILIRSYYKDFGWLRYALRSIRKYCRGFSKVIVVVPKSSRQKLDWMGLAGDVTITCPNYRDDYLGPESGLPFQDRPVSMRSRDRSAT